MAESWKLTATEVQVKIRKGELTVEEYANSLLNRIKTRDPMVKAWAFIDSDYVLSQARKLDQIPLERRGPLHGFAIGVKDVILTKDMPTAYNSPIFQDKPIQNVDAGPIITLRESGALLIGKTHTTEFAASMDGPPTRNPHNFTHTPGGSSSGSGAAVGDYQVPIALGTQTMGSVIRPGSYNGCYSYKPTWGSISREGLAMSSATFDTFGMFSRSIQDFEAVADVFKLTDDESTPKMPFSLQGAKIGFCQTPVWSTKETPALKAAWVKAQMLLSDHGAIIEAVVLPGEFAKMADWHKAVCWGEGRSSFLGQYLTGKDKLHPGLVDYIEERAVTNHDLLEAYDSCARLRPLFDKIAGAYDVVITPTAPDEAPEGFKTGDGSFCLTWTMLHVPVVNVPGFSGTTGLPLGLSLLGPRYSDRSLLRVAQTIGNIFENEGGWHHDLF